jgi:hypothetical protein
LVIDNINLVFQNQFYDIFIITLNSNLILPFQQDHCALSFGLSLKYIYTHLYMHIGICIYREKNIIYPLIKFNLYNFGSKLSL